MNTPCTAATVWECLWRSYTALRIWQLYGDPSWFLSCSNLALMQFLVIVWVLYVIHLCVIWIQIRSSGLDGCGRVQQILRQTEVKRRGGEVSASVRWEEMFHRKLSKNEQCVSGSLLTTFFFKSEKKKKQPKTQKQWIIPIYHYLESALFCLLHVIKNWNTKNEILFPELHSTAD